VKIPPLSLFKLFNGSVDRWLHSLPESMDRISIGLEELCKRYNIKMIYLNLPQVIPYLLMARNHAGLDIGLLFLAHSVGSEYWMRQWIAIAPWLTEKDVLISSTNSSRKALLQISDRYRLARHIPLCIEMRNDVPDGLLPLNRKERHILSIGRIEDVKNIHLLLKGFAAIHSQVPSSHLTIAGEYTGQSDDQMIRYKQRLEHAIREFGLENFVTFFGPAEGERKDKLFRRSELLINLSTDPGETFGFNLIEAKTWGIPVVCSNWDGFKEVVTHGTDGYLIDCRWEQEHPYLRLDQAVEYCVNLLLNEPLRRAFSERAREAASHYNYRRITPLIVKEVLAASGQVISLMPDVLKIAYSNLLELPDYYNIENLRHFPFCHRSLLAISNSGNMDSLDTWMPMAKPIIHHFAGTVIYAEH
jgi:glycosyltransferase involved in cell wall biosynthesis